jgi:uncharacterized protein (UPF0333 family)
MKIMDGKGQISVEYILIIGFLLALILVVVTIISNQNEENSVATAVRSGASDALTAEAMLNTSMQPVRVTSQSMTNGNNIFITVQLSNSTVPNSLKMKILTGSKNSLEEMGYNPSPSSSVNSLNFTFNTQRHVYFVSVA